MKAFLKAGILGEDQVVQGHESPAPRRVGSSHPCSATSPSRSSTIISSPPGRLGRLQRPQLSASQGLATYRLVRYADDFVVLVAGTRAHAEGLRDEVAEVLQPMGLRLSEDEDDDRPYRRWLRLLGFRIQRKSQRGTEKRYVYTCPSKTALAAVKAKVRALTRGGTNQPLTVLLRRLNPVLRGWANYFRHGVSSTTFDYLNAYSWRRVVIWLRHKHPRALEMAPSTLPTRVATDGGRSHPAQPDFDAGHPLPIPGRTDSLAVADSGIEASHSPATWARGEPDAVERRTSGSEVRAGEIGPAREAGTAPRPDPYLKNPQNLTENQRASLARVAAVNKSRHRAYLLKEEFRLIFQLRGDDAIVALDGWLVWAQRCRIPAFVELYHRIKNTVRPSKPP